MTPESHYLFEHHFCHVGWGNEEYHVEDHVDYSRRILLVPVPSFPSWRALNKVLIAELMRCEYIDKKENILIVDNFGTGTSHLTTALATQDCAKLTTATRNSP